LNLHHEITRSITRETGIPLTPEENRRFAGTQSVNPEAYRLYLRGIYFSDGLVQNPQKAIDFFNQALKIDSTFSLAYARLALALIHYGALGFFSREEVYSSSQASIRKAFLYDPELAEAYTALGALKLWYDWDWTAAEQAFKKALLLNPNSARTYFEYVPLLGAVQRKKEGLAMMEKALELDPFSPYINLSAGYTYHNFDLYDEAISQYKYTTEMVPGSPRPHIQLAWTYAAKGDYEKALAECEIFEKQNPGSKFAGLGWVYALAGQKNKALKILNMAKENAESNPRYTYPIAKIYASLGNKDKAFEWLEIAYQHRLVSFVLFQCASKPHLPLGFLRSDPRYWDLLKRLNFPEN
jgi:tetratricopeptide (TPR) repeat protein